MAQPFRAYAKTLLEKQTYPVQRRGGRHVAGAAVRRRRLDAALQMGVKVDRIEQTFEPPPTTRLERASIAPAQIWGDRKPGYYIIDGRGNGGSIAVNRLQAAGLERVVDDGGRSRSKASPTRPAPSSSAEPAKARAVVEGIVTALGLRATGVRGRPPAGTTPLARARVGLYKPWIENIDEGWTRWVLEQYEFPFESLTDRDIRRGGLRARVDVIILARSGAGPDHERSCRGHDAAGVHRRHRHGGRAPRSSSSSMPAGRLITLDSVERAGDHAAQSAGARSSCAACRRISSSCRGRSCG